MTPWQSAAATCQSGELPGTACAKFADELVLRVKTCDSTRMPPASCLAVPSATLFRLTNRSTRSGAQGIRIGGTYSDPAHPGCTRKVTLIGTNKVLIEGADEDGKKFISIEVLPHFL